MTIKTVFDGQKIVLPKELAGHAPCEVQITFVESGKGTGVGSIWDVVEKATGTSRPEELLDAASRDRDLWESE
jgi:hypothetical protein